MYIVASDKAEEELLGVKDTSSVSRQAAATFPHWGRLVLSDCHVCGGRAITASGGLFDEPIGSAYEMPQGGYRKPPARLVVMTLLVRFVIFFQEFKATRVLFGSRGVKSFALDYYWNVKLKRLCKHCLNGCLALAERSSVGVFHAVS